MFSLSVRGLSPKNAKPALPKGVWHCEIPRAQRIATRSEAKDDALTDSSLVYNTRARVEISQPTADTYARGRHVVFGLNNFHEIYTYIRLNFRWRSDYFVKLVLSGDNGYAEIHTRGWGQRRRSRCPYLTLSPHGLEHRKYINLKKLKIKISLYLCLFNYLRIIMVILHLSTVLNFIQL